MAVGAVIRGPEESPGRTAVTARRNTGAGRGAPGAEVTPGASLWHSLTYALAFSLLFSAARTLSGALWMETFLGFTSGVFGR